MGLNGRDTRGVPIAYCSSSLSERSHCFFGILLVVCTKRTSTGFQSMDHSMHSVMERWILLDVLQRQIPCCFPLNAERCLCSENERFMPRSKKWPLQLLFFYYVSIHASATTRNKKDLLPTSTWCALLGKEAPRWFWLPVHTSRSKDGSMLARFNATCMSRMKCTIVMLGAMEWNLNLRAKTLTLCLIYIYLQRKRRQLMLLQRRRPRRFLPA